MISSRVDVKGVSCHGSAPERGDNAIYKMADILQDVRARACPRRTVVHIHADLYVLAVLFDSGQILNFL